MRAKDTSKLVKEKIEIIKSMFMAGCKVAEIEEKTGLVNLLDFTRRHNRYFRDVKFIKRVKRWSKMGKHLGEYESRV